MNRIIILLGIVLSHGAFASEVIYNKGKTRSLAPYYEQANVRPPTFDMKNTPIKLPKNPAAFLKGMVNDNFPVKSKYLTLGKIESRKIAIQQFNQPACLVGDDNISHKWLTHHHKALVKLNAICFVVNVSSAKSFSNFKRRYKGLSFVADEGQMFADKLGVRHYPVLISKEYIEQ